MGMRKVFAVVLALVFGLSVFGCSSDPYKDFFCEDLVTMEQLNTDSKYVARGYLEALFLNNREMFGKCFPEGYIEDMEKVIGGDVFDQFANTTVLGGDFLGSASTEYRDATVNNGYDVASLKSRICRVAACEYSDIGNIRIQKVQVLFMNSKEKKDADFYFIVYEMDGIWYMYELWSLKEF